MICPESSLGDTHKVHHIHKSNWACSCGCVFEWLNKYGMKIMKHSPNFMKSSLVVKEVKSVKAEEVQVEDPEKEEAEKIISENQIS